MGNSPSVDGGTSCSRMGAGDRCQRIADIPCAGRPAQPGAPPRERFVRHRTRVAPARAGPAGVAGRCSCGDRAGPVRRELAACPPAGRPRDGAGQAARRPPALRCGVRLLLRPAAATRVAATSEDAAAATRTAAAPPALHRGPASHSVADFLAGGPAGIRAVSMFVLFPSSA